MKKQIYTLIIISLILSMSLISATEDTIILVGDNELSIFQKIINWFKGLGGKIEDKSNNRTRPIEDEIELEDSSPSKKEVILSEIKSIFVSEPERKEECRNTFERLNEIREDYGREKLNWDDRAYTLAVERSKDMYERDYFDHVTPEGTCADTMKKNYGFSNYEWLAENAGGMSYYGKGDVAGDCDEALDGWLNSRGHRYNLLYYGHDLGAIGCYHELCIFFGVNNDGFGEGCYTAEEGESFWEFEPQLSDEV